AKNLVAVLEADAEHRIGQQLDHLSAHLEQFFLGQAIPLCSGEKSRSLSCACAKCEGGGSDGEDGRPGRSAAFESAVRFGGVLQRKALLHLDLDLATLNDGEQLGRRLLKLVARDHIVEQRRPRQKQRAVLREQRRREWVDQKGSLFLT